MTDFLHKIALIDYIRHLEARITELEARVALEGLILPYQTDPPQYKNLGRWLDGVQNNDLLPLWIETY